MNEKKVFLILLSKFKIFLLVALVFVHGKFPIQL